MKNKVKFNLKNVHAAKLTETVTDGVTTFSYATPRAIPGAVQYALRAPRAIQLGFFAKKPRKTPRVSGGSVQ